MGFEQATRTNAKLRMALDGPAGSGKTFTMLQILKLLHPNPGVIDSERAASKKYAQKPNTAEGPGNWKFRLNPLGEKKNPDAYMLAIAEAREAKIDVLGIDSFSHSWLGALEDVDKATPSGGSKFSNGWKAVSPKVNKLVDVILNYPGHVIATMRAKTEYEIVKDEKTGKSKPQKIGLASVSRDGTDYEFDIMLNLALDGTITVAKSRAFGVLEAGQVFSREEIPALVAAIKSWLDEGAPISPLEDLRQRLRCVESQEEIDTLLPELGALSKEEKLQLLPDFKVAKERIAGATVADTGDAEVPT